MHLVSQGRPNILLAGELFQFEQGESIHAENSYKYTVQEFQQLAGAAGWHPEMTWHVAMDCSVCITWTSSRGAVAVRAIQNCGTVFLTQRTFINVN